MSRRYLNANRIEISKSLRIQFEDTAPFSDDNSSRTMTSITSGKREVSDYWAEVFFSDYYPHIAHKWVRNWEITVTVHFGEYQEVFDLRAKCLFRDLDEAAKDAVLEGYNLGNANHFTKVSFDCRTVGKFKKIVEKAEVVSYEVS